MFRTALKPRWLLLLLVVLAASAGMATLGDWQLDRARDSSRRAQEKRLSAAPVELTSLVTARRPYPASGVDRPVTAAGRWDAQRQLLLPGRERDGRRGMWVLTPLVLADGSAVPVVRGWVASAGEAAATAAPSPAEVTVTGVLQPSEPRLKLEPGTDLGLPPGQVPRIDVTDLVQRWPYPLIDAYVRLGAQSPAADGPAPVADPVRARSSGVAWRNLSYALQWWIFAAFGLFMWWRIVRDDAQGAFAPSGTAPSTSGGPPEPAVPTRPDPEASS